MKALYLCALFVFCFSVFAGPESYGDALQNEDSVRLSQEWMRLKPNYQNLFVFSDLDELKAHFGGRGEKIVYILTTGEESRVAAYNETLKQEVKHVEETYGKDTRIVFITPGALGSAMAIENFVQAEGRGKKNLFVVGIASHSQAEEKIKALSSSPGRRGEVISGSSVATDKKNGILLLSDNAIAGSLADIALGLSQHVQSYLQYMVNKGNATDGSIPSVIEYMLTPTAARKRLLLHIGNYQYSNASNHATDLAGAAIYRFLLENPQLVTALDLEVQVATDQGKMEFTAFAKSEEGQKLKQYFDRLPEIIQGLRLEAAIKDKKGERSSTEKMAIESLAFLTSARVTELVALQLASFAARQRMMIDNSKRSFNASTSQEEMTRLFTVEAYLRKIGTTVGLNPILMNEVKMISARLTGGDLTLERIMRAKR